MSLIMGAHPEPMTTVIVQGSAADLAVPAEMSLTAPTIEFGPNRAADPSVSHTLASELGAWVVHLTEAQVAALSGLHYARLRVDDRIIAAGQVQHNPGWDGRTRSRASTSIVFGPEAVALVTAAQAAAGLVGAPAGAAVTAAIGVGGAARATLETAINGRAVRHDAAQALAGAAKTQARDNLGLGSAATAATGDFATAAQGAKADSAVQPAALGTAAPADIGTAPGQVKPGDWKPAAADVTDSTATGRSVLTAADGPAARSAISAAQVPRNGARAVGEGALTFNVIDFGAVSGSGDDTAAFQAAMDAAAAAVGLGAEVYIPPGVFHIANVIVPDLVRVRGAGNRASKVICTAIGIGLSIGKENTLTDFWLTTDAIIAGGVGIRFRSGSTHSTLERMSISKHENAVIVEYSWVVQVRDCYIQANTTGVRLVGGNCNAFRVSGGEMQGNVDGMVVESGSHYAVKLIGTTIEGNSGRGFYCEGTIAAFSARDCYFEANVGGSLVWASGPYREALSPVIDGCYFGGNMSNGVLIPDSVGAREVTVRNNTFNITGVAIRLGTGTQVARVSHNWYIANPFVPATHFTGIQLILDEGGKLTLRPSAGSTGASLNLPPGNAPTTPVDGDVWTTTAGLYARIAGATQGPYVSPATAQAINTQTGTTYTLTAADAGKLVTTSNAAAVTVTVPASVFSAGQQADLLNIGGGQVTIAAGSGMTVNGTPTLKTRAQYSALTIKFLSATSAVVVGDLAAS